MSQYGLELAWFVHEMAKKLQQNVKKPHWHGEGIDYLFNRLKEEADELQSAIDNKAINADAVISEAADVANFSMMIADWAKAYKEANPMKPPPAGGDR
jgi:NTP pyrophosphatase (non-canonical NTP hydrolase)